jgi:hypothetical protein
MRQGDTLYLKFHDYLTSNFSRKAAPRRTRSPSLIDEEGEGFIRALVLRTVDQLEADETRASKRGRRG